MRFNKPQIADSLNVAAARMVARRYSLITDMKMRFFVFATIFFYLLSAQPRAAAADVLPALAQTLASTEDPQLQLDILRGISAALRGQRKVTMPHGWEAVETRLSTSASPEVRALAQSISLTFGSEKALTALRRAL